MAKNMEILVRFSDSATLHPATEIFIRLGRHADNVVEEGNRKICYSPLSETVGLEILKSYDSLTHLKKMLLAELQLGIGTYASYKRYVDELYNYCRQDNEKEHAQNSVSALSGFNIAERAALEAVLRHFNIPILDSLEMTCLRQPRQHLAVFMRAVRRNIPLTRIAMEEYKKHGTKFQRYYLLDEKGQKIGGNWNPDYALDEKQIDQALREDAQKIFSSIRYKTHVKASDSELQDLRIVFMLLQQMSKKITCLKWRYRPEVIARFICGTSRYVSIFKDLDVPIQTILQSLCELEVSETVGSEVATSEHAPYLFRVEGNEYTKFLEMARYYTDGLIDLLDLSHTRVTGSLIPACYPHLLKMQCSDTEYIDFFYPATYTVPENFAEFRRLLTGSVNKTRTIRERNDELTFTVDNKSIKLWRVPGADIDIAVDCAQEDFERIANQHIQVIMKKYPQAKVAKVDRSKTGGYDVTNVPRNIQIYRADLKRIMLHHVSMVRGFIGKDLSIHLAATALHSFRSGSSYNYYYFAGKNSPMEIILKYQQRGFRFLLNNKAKALLQAFRKGSEKWGEEDFIFPCRGHGNFNLDNLEMEEAKFKHLLGQSFTPGLQLPGYRNVPSMVPALPSGVCSMPSFQRAPSPRRHNSPPRISVPVMAPQIPGFPRPVMARQISPPRISVPVMAPQMPGLPIAAVPVIQPNPNEALLKRLEDDLKAKCKH